MRNLRSFASLRGCEEILSGVGPRGGSEGSSVTPAGLGPIAQTVRLVAQRGRWFLRRSVGNAGSGVTKDPSLPPLGPTLAQDFFTASQDDGRTPITSSVSSVRCSSRPRPDRPSPP